MSRRSFLNEVLSGTPSELLGEKPSTEPAQPSFTAKKLDGFTEAARMVKKPTLRLKPSECSVWQGNARDYDLLTEDRLRSLIDSIQAEGGNRIPVTVRRTPKGEKPFELVVGTRRHWAVSWLNANSYPDIELLASIEDIDDEAAFRLADVENREREDISDIERGKNYKVALDRHYGGVITRMAERLKIPNSVLRRYILCTEIPGEILAAFATPLHLMAYYADVLVPLIRRPDSFAKMKAEAERLAIEQSFRVSGNEDPIPGPEVMRRLVKASTEKRAPRRKAAIEVSGEPIGKIDRDQTQALTLTLTPNGLPVDAILETLRPIIEQAKIRKGQ